MNVHAFSDAIMQGLMQRLDIPIPAWIVRRRVRVTREHTDDADKYTILVEGQDPDQKDIPFTLFKCIRVNTGEKKVQQIDKAPYAVEVPKKHAHPIDIELHFFGHYNEIPFNLHYNSVGSIPQEAEFYLFYNPLVGKWHKTIKDDDFPV